MSTRASSVRVWTIARETVREALRQRLLAGVLLLALGLIGGAHALRDFNFGAPELKFIADLGLGAIHGFGAVLAIAGSAQLFSSECEQRSVLTVLAKPLRREEFVAGKYAGILIVIFGFCIVLTLLLAGVLWARETVSMRETGAGRTVNYAWLGLAGGVVAMKLSIVSALTLLVASYAGTSWLATMAGFALFVAAHLQPVAAAVWQRSESWAVKLIAGAVGWLLPNLAWIEAPTNGKFSWPCAGGAALYTILYVLIVGMAAAACFRRHEL